MTMLKCEITLMTILIKFVITSSIFMLSCIKPRKFFHPLFIDEDLLSNSSYRAILDHSPIQLMLLGFQGYGLS